MPQLNLKILIDSGATDSIMNPNVATKFKNYLHFEPFSVMSLNKTIQSDKNVIFPLLAELNIKEPIKLRVVQWHTKFDVLIGTKDLHNIDANVNYKNRILTLQNIQIPFFLEYRNDKATKTSTKQKYLEIPVTIDESEVFIPTIKLNNEEEIPECIATARKEIYKIPNPTQQTEINFNERINVLPLDYLDFEQPEENQDLNKSSKIHRLIRTDHLNKEERRKITSICKTYSEIFYRDGTDLTFASHVKHKIKTTDENPIYVKSFRHPRAMQIEINEQIQKLLDNKIIRHLSG